jgi:ribosome assembly protein YihI (activator of Der GTPase)
MLLNNKQKLEDILYRLQKGEDITQQDAEFITEFSKRMNKINPNFEIVEFVEVNDNDSD